MNLLPLRFVSRFGPTRLVALALAVLLVGSACSSADDSGQAQVDTDGNGNDTTASAAPAETPDTGGDTSDDGDSDTGTSDNDEKAAEVSAALAELVTELPPAPVGFPATEDGPRPISLTIDSLGIDNAPVIDVGVETSGDMEVPPADQVGWYRYSPLPGESGSSILAAHIAFDGENGVFVRLADVDLGAVVEVTDEDGLTRSYQVESVERYDKEALPEDVVFARSGPERLVLVTCGGRFDPDLRSYDDNVVVVATPISPAG